MKTKLLWLSSLTCNGNAHSFLNYHELSLFLDNFEFIYHPIIDSSYTLDDIAKKDIECDILLIEGAISKELKKGDISVIDMIKKYAKKAYRIVTVGTCASFGGMFKNKGEGLHFLQERELEEFRYFKDKTVSVSGCPVHPEVLADTLYMIKRGYDIKLDKFLRPKEFFSYTVHNGCTRNEYFEYKIDNHNYGEKEGCLFYDHGCQAPYTNGSCNKILWNEVNSKTRAGLACFGCTQPQFPKENLFFTKKNMGIPQYLPLGVAKRVYLTLAGISKTFKIERLEKKLFDD